MNRLKYHFLVKLYSTNRITRLLFYRYIDKNEGGQFRSNTLRRICRENYCITVGDASYGCFNPVINRGFPIQIGSYCSFAGNIHFIPGKHPPTDVSTHPYFHIPSFGFVNNSGGEN